MKYPNTLVLSLLMLPLSLILTLPAPSPYPDLPYQPATDRFAELSDEWNVLLEMFVSSDGLVDYEGFQRAAPQLDAFLERLAGAVPSGSTDKETALAYWLNAYNAFTIKMVIDNYPFESMKDLHEGEPWDHVWITLGDREYSLNMIEHDILRVRFDDPRIHFAINYAAVSCPPLYDRSFKAHLVDKQLEYLAHKFINDPEFNKISKNTLQLSKVFEWYRDDFGNLRDFIHRYAMVYLDKTVHISFLPYDWSLNSATRSSN